MGSLFDMGACDIIFFVRVMVTRYFITQKISWNFSIRRNKTEAHRDRCMLITLHSPLFIMNNDDYTKTVVLDSSVISLKQWM